jgi:hypothetical protein
VIVSFKRVTNLFLITVLVALVSACGGGGGGSSSKSPPPITLSTNADLVELTLSDVPLDQTFQASQLSYTASVNFLTHTTTVKPITDDANATVTVNGAAVVSGSDSEPIALSEEVNTIAVLVTAEDGTTTNTYTVEVTVQTAGDFAQQAYTKASDAKAADRFGSSIALSEDSLAVRADRADAVYVFTRENGIWNQEAHLNINGSAIALSEDTLAVGASGEPWDDAGGGVVVVFTRDNGIWSQEAILKGSNTEGAQIDSGILFGDGFGSSVALSGDTLAVGAVGESSSATGGEDDNSESGAGAAYVFTRNNGSWNQEAFLKASNAKGNYDSGMGFLLGDRFGSSIALSGNTLAVGASFQGGSGEGAVYVFIHANGVWNQEAFLESVGASVAVSGDDLAVGSRSGFNDGGAVSVFRRSSDTWSQQANLKAPNGGITEYPKDFSCGSFIPPDGFSTQFSDNFGASVALSGETLIVGAPGESSSATGGEADNSALFAGAVYVFTRTNGTWNQELFLKASNADGGCTWSGTGIPTYGGDRFGQSVALSGSTIAVGAPAEGSSASGGEADNSADGAGAVYVFK